MADLEEMGYIIQPHTSAGRIPTDKGYRLYVDSMMEENARQVEELKEMLVEKEEKMDHLLKQVAKVLAVNTNYATLVPHPDLRETRLNLSSYPVSAMNRFWRLWWRREMSLKTT